MFKVFLLLICFVFGLAFADTRKCRALVLAGGGDQGAYQVGAIKALIEKLAKEETRYDVVSGVSIGAVNALLISTYGEGEEQQMLENLISTWQKITKKDIYKDWFPGGVVEGIVSKQGLFNNAPSRNYLKNLIKGRTIKRKLNFATTNANSGQYMRYTESNLIQDGQDKFLDHILSSMALPGLFSPVTEGDNTYIDGSVLISLDIDGAIQRCKEIVEDESDIILDIILCTGKELVEVDEKNAHAIPMLMRFLAISSYKGTLDDLFHQTIDHPRINFRHVIMPKHKLEFFAFPLDFEQDHIKKLFDFGYNDALKIIENDSNNGYLKDLLEEHRRSRKPQRYRKQN